MTPVIKWGDRTTKLITDRRAMPHCPTGFRALLQFVPNCTGSRNSFPIVAGFYTHIIVYCIMWPLGLARGLARSWRSSVYATAHGVCRAEREWNPAEQRPRYWGKRLWPWPFLPSKGVAVRSNGDGLNASINLKATATATDPWRNNMKQIKKYGKMKNMKKKKILYKNM